MIPDPRQLRYFLAVVEAGSLSRAAAVLHLSEPALSKSIRLLEQSLQVQLLERHARGISPTMFGRALAERAKVIRSELRFAYEEINTLRSAEQGHVIVGALPSYAADILPRAVSQLLAFRPRVRVTVHEALADSLIRMVLAGDVDFAIMTVRPYDIDPALVQEFLQQRELPVVVMGAAHPQCGKRELDLAELNELEWILPPKHDGMRLEFERLFEDARMLPPRPAIESSSVLFIRTALQEGPFVSYLPRTLVQQELRQKVLTSADIKTKRHQTNVGFLYRRQCTLTPTAQMLLNRIKDLVVGSDRDRVKAREA